MKALLSTCAIFSLLVVTIFAQQQATWANWSRKDTEKILNDSAWGQTQLIGGGPGTLITSASVPANTSPDSIARSLEDQLKASGIKPATPVNYNVRFLTAKPIRQALARLMMLSQENPDNQILEQLQSFIDRDFGDYVIIGLDIRRAGFNDLVENTFKEATLDSLKENTYLQYKDGKRVSLVDYRLPDKEDGIGVKFVFPRTINGKPFITAETVSVRFACEFNKLKVNKTFKVSDMMYNGKIEY